MTKGSDRLIKAHKKRTAQLLSCVLSAQEQLFKLITKLEETECSPEQKAAIEKARIGYYKAQSESAEFLGNAFIFLSKN
jgi:hypothetical protein